MKIRDIIVENDEEDMFGHSDRVGNDLRRVTYRQRIPSMIKMIHGGLEANAGSLVKQMAAELGRDADVFRRDPEIFDLANELISEIAAQVSDILMNLDPVMINDEDALNNALSDYTADIRSHCNLWIYIEEVLGEAGDDDGAYACAMTIEGEIGALLIKLIQHAYSQLSLSEAFDKPYKGKWEKSDYGDVDLNTKLPDGTYLNIMFNQEYDGEGEEVVQVEFHRNNSQEVTGEGDAQRIFATVLDAIQKYIKKYKPQRLSFSASKSVDMDADDVEHFNPESRAKLYTRLVQRYAGAWGYQAQVDDNGDVVIYQLTRTMAENADDKENTADQVRNKLNAWMEQDQQFKDPTQREGFQAKVWPYIQENIRTILADKGKKGNGDYPAAPYAAWLLVQHMDAYPQNQIEFYNKLKQAIPDHPKIQFLRDRAAVNQWILQNANNKEYWINGKALPNPTVNVRNPAMFKDAGIVATSREEALTNAEQAGNKLLVAAVNATKAKTQPSYKQGVAEGSENFNGIDIDMEIEGDEIMVRAMANGRELGHVLFVEDGEYLMPQDLEVDERFQGQGIAATMYDYVKSKGYKIRRSGQQTDAGAGFWRKHRPEQNVWENFHDGRHPEDKGDSKRLGVPTKASISTLRKVAKQGGRKGQLAHWMANMKSGRAKAKK